MENELVRKWRLTLFFLTPIVICLGIGASSALNSGTPRVIAFVVVGGLFLADGLVRFFRSDGAERTIFVESSTVALQILSAGAYTYFFLHELMPTLPPLKPWWAVGFLIVAQIIGYDIAQRRLKRRGGLATF